MKSEGEAPGRVPAKTPGRTEPVGKATAETVAILGEKSMSVRDQLSKLRPKIRIEREVCGAQASASTEEAESASKVPGISGSSFQGTKVLWWIETMWNRHV